VKNESATDGTVTPLRQRIREIDENTSSRRFLMFIRREWHTLLDSIWCRGRLKP
jgi:hypothetical protein